jgi:hypothetical protein
MSPWTIADGPIEEYTSWDGELWAWCLRAPNRSHVIRVFISGTAIAAGKNNEYTPTRMAVADRGRSAVESLLDMEDPPTLIEFTTPA